MAFLRGAYSKRQETLFLVFLIVFRPPAFSRSSAGLCSPGKEAAILPDFYEERLADFLPVFSPCCEDQALGSEESSPLPCALLRHPPAPKQKRISGLGPPNFRPLGSTSDHDVVAFTRTEYQNSLFLQPSPAHSGAFLQVGTRYLFQVRTVLFFSFFPPLQ